MKPQAIAMRRFTPCAPSAALLQAEKGTPLTVQELDAVLALKELEALCLDFFDRETAAGRSGEREAREAAGWLQQRVRSIRHRWVQAWFSPGPLANEDPWTEAVSLHDGPPLARAFEDDLDRNLADVARTGYARLESPHDTRLASVHDLLARTFPPEELASLDRIKAALEATQLGQRAYFVDVLWDSAARFGANSVLAAILGERLTSGSEAFLIVAYIAARRLARKRPTRLGETLLAQYRARQADVRYVVAEATADSLPFHARHRACAVTAQNADGEVSVLPYMQPASEYDLRGSPTLQAAPETLVLHDRDRGPRIAASTVLGMIERVYQAWYYPKPQWEEALVREHGLDKAAVQQAREAARRSVDAHLEAVRSWCEAQAELSLTPLADLAPTRSTLQAAPRLATEVEQAVRALVVGGENQATMASGLPEGIVVSDETHLDPAAYGLLASAFGESEVESPETTAALLATRKLKNVLGARAYAEGFASGGHIEYDYLNLTLRDPVTREPWAVGIGNFLGGKPGSLACVILPENMVVAESWRRRGLNRVLYRVFADIGKLYAARNRCDFLGICSERNVPLESSLQDLLADSINPVTRLIVSGKLGQYKLDGKYQQASLSPGKPIAVQPRLAILPPEGQRAMALPSAVFLQIVDGFERHSMRKTGPHEPWREVQFRESKRSVGIRTVVPFRPIVGLDLFTAVAYLCYGSRGESIAGLAALRQVISDAFEFLQYGKHLDPEARIAVCRLLAWVEAHLRSARETCDLLWSRVQRGTGSRRAAYRQYIDQLERALGGLAVAIESFEPCDSSIAELDETRKDLAQAGEGKSTELTLLRQTETILVVSREYVAGLWAIMAAAQELSPEAPRFVVCLTAGGYRIQGMAPDERSRLAMNLKPLAWELSSLEYLTRLRSSELPIEQARSEARVGSNLSAWSDEGNYATHVEQSSLSLEVVLGAVERHARARQSAAYQAVVDMAMRGDAVIAPTRVPILACELAERERRGSRLSLKGAVRRLVDEGEELRGVVRWALGLRPLLDSEGYPRAWDNFERVSESWPGVTVKAEASGRVLVFEAAMAIAEARALGAEELVGDWPDVFSRDKQED